MISRRLGFIVYINGLFLIALSAVMVLPMLVDYGSNNQDAGNFLACIVLVGGTGGFLVAGFRKTERERIVDRRTGYLLTVSAWLSISFFGSLPLLISSLNLSFTDAMFETVSGLATAGSTILTGLDTMPPGLLLWRSLLNWIGGIGIVGMALAVLPMLNVGGMQLFRSESSDVSGKPFPRVAEMARAVGSAYVGLTALSAFSLIAAGMSPFDAVNHAMAAIATGGFSTKDASVGFFDSVPIECILTASMIAGALPLSFYANFFVSGHRVLLEDQQISAFLKIWAVAVGAMVVWNVFQGMEPYHALRVSTFNVTSILTDTGFASTDFSTWGSFATGFFLMLYFVGGCAGSTSGGVKVFRWQLLFAGALRHLRQTLSPNRVQVVHYQHQAVENETLSAVRTFLFLYIITYVVLTLLVMATGLDLLSAMSSIAQAMAGAGPGLGPEVGPATTFAGVSTTAKWIIMSGMLLGRLELVTVYVVLLPEFWRG
ncbi:TrkH family potassium uptake protein [Consotaella salsifontis]|uniref:Trk system potassium uptake protein n=1 Tax=Consotaella salsifontis TaxID=1365950 RepID=A0A1T4M8D6_9HYPH|nr:TrkH family potassium uptake protein [Consotaella salsifontis]SJZ62964.1 trk system potassium uptake protein TrkH [Consotaella salsifontis]